MENKEYYKMLLNGYFQHRSYLKDHIYREFKKAEKNFIYRDEFFGRCNNIIQWLENEFDKRVNEQKREYYDILHCLKHEPETVNLGEIPIDQHIIEIENRLKTISRNDFPINLKGLDLIYNLDYSELQFIETAIKQAIAMTVLDEILLDLPKTEQPKGKPAPAKSFSEYILHEKNIKFAEALKDEFKTEKGKSIKLIIEVLIKKNMITIENRQRTKIYKAIQTYFNRDIGTKQSIFDYQYKEKDKPDFESIELRINTILSRIK